MTNRKKVPLSSSNGLVLITSPDRPFGGGEVHAENPVGQQSEAAEVGESRTLRQPGQPGQEQFWRDIRDGEVMVDDFLQGLAGQRTAVGKINKAIVNQLHPDG